MSNPSRRIILSDFYQNFYQQRSRDLSHIQWRSLSASFKARNILSALPHLSSLNNILEVGSGTGELSHHLVEYYSCPPIHQSDVSENALAEAADRYPCSIASSTLLTPGELLPFKDNTFDVVICSHVLEHVIDPVFLLRDLLRISNLVFIEVPIDFRYYSIPTQALLDCGHIHAFSASTIRFYIDQAHPVILFSGYSYTQNALSLSLFHALRDASSSRKPLLSLFELIRSFVRWVLVSIKIRLRSFLGNPGTEAFYLLRKTL